MNCPGLDHCEIREHKGYQSCAHAGECHNNPRHAPASASSSAAVVDESAPEEGWAWWDLLAYPAVLAVLFIALAGFLQVDLR